MTNPIILVEKRSDWKALYPNLPIVTAREYLADTERYAVRGLRVLNFCRSYRYLSVGYYCSLLAEARGQRVIPSVRTINDLSRKSIYSLDIEDLDEQVQQTLGKPSAGFTATAFELDILFGQCSIKTLQDLSRQLYDLFRAPLLKVEFRLQGKWRIAALKPQFLHTLSDAQETAFVTALSGYLSQRWHSARTRDEYRYDLAILHNPKEPFPPSNARALKAFARAGKDYGLNVEFIGKKDLGRLAEFDALFIRETTGIDHYTYQFAKKAESEGMVVIDDPNSILRCTNKVYLEELLRANKVRTPKTLILSRERLERLNGELDYPIVLKIPDGSFSRGVFKAENPAELLTLASKLFKSSDLILAQEFLYTEFDWRVGIMDKTPLFICQYFMSAQHWQIYNHGTGGRSKDGDFTTLPIAEAPEQVVKTALKAANLIGNGLYGVDLKQTGDQVVVMEVNDNPNIDAGVEDYVLKEALYRTIIESFVQRLDKKRSRK